MKEINFPDGYLDRMKNLLGDEFQDYADSFGEERFYGLRVNTSKISPKDFSQKAPMKLTSVPWIANGFYYGGEDRPAKDPYYYAGLYYLQEPSAMTPANLLPITPGDRVLDVCAAPGGKSTELGVRLKGEGMLVSNDISHSRAKALLKNLELWGIPNICVTGEKPEKLAEVFGEFFDKILIDAPCSGEGMFRKDADMMKSYEEHGPEYYAAIQRTIVDEAIRMLVPGGLMLYSTCTFSICEDEDIIKGILERYSFMELVKLELFEGACDGIGLSGCIRLFPHKIKGEGHFIALLRKKGEHIRLSVEALSGKNRDEKLPESFLGFLEFLNWKLDFSRIMIKDNLIYYLPQGFPKGRYSSLRYLRTGLLLGELKKDRFEPSQALSMALKKDEFKQVLSWERTDERVIRYLKGETITLNEDEGPAVGWILICVDGFPLGFAKGTGMTLKNKYYPGWRWQ